MQTILESGQKGARQAAHDAAVESVAQKKLRVDFDETGRVETSVNVTKGALTFSAYLKALLRGQRSVTAGGRVDVDLDALSRK